MIDMRKLTKKLAEKIDEYKITRDEKDLEAIEIGIKGLEEFYSGRMKVQLKEDTLIFTPIKEVEEN